MMKEKIIEILNKNSFNWHNQTVIYEASFKKIAIEIIKSCNTHSDIELNDNQIKLKDNGFSALEEAIKKANDV